MSLEKAYDSIKSYIPKNNIESFEVLKQIQEYWNYWKPINTVNVLLLAESHVYTSQEDFEASYSKIKLESFIKNYPIKFVRLVYCFAYGEPDLLNESLEDNSGTTQFWKIFCACTSKTENDLAFRRILKSDVSFFPRMRNKVNILNELKARGIWLIDSSLVGIYRGAIDEKSDVICASWDNYVKDVVIQAHPKYIAVIGKGVADSLGRRLSSICSTINADYTVLPQPQAVRGPHEEQMEYYRQYQRICSKYA
ncbi:MAG: hypothetical protein ABSF44_09480 [Candidatus Bathyarchaeia archaeon]|jgi:hypothetical protein